MLPVFCALIGNFMFGQGALTHGDRRATESRDLSRFNFDNKVSEIQLPASGNFWQHVMSMEQKRKVVTV